MKLGSIDFVQMGEVGGTPLQRVSQQIFLKICTMTDYDIIHAFVNYFLIVILIG